MPANKEWYFDVKDSYIHIVKNATQETNGPVFAVKASNDKIRIKLLDQEAAREKSLVDFTWEKSPFSRQFKNAKSATQFHEEWTRLVLPRIDSNTGKYQDEPLVQLGKHTSPSTGLGPSKKKKIDEDSDNDIIQYYTGCYEIPISCLMEPRMSRCLRPPDRVFINTLKDEIMANQISTVSPIIGIPCLDDGQEFDKKHPALYKYETIGGNHSRIALQELAVENPRESLQTRLVAVYTGVDDDVALMIASKHNRATDLTHKMTTQDQVMICRSRYAGRSSKTEWRKACASLLSLQVQQLEYSMVFFLASLPDVEYDCVLEIFAQYELCDLKNQKLSRGQRQVAKISKISCKGVNFKPLRGLEEEERRNLLQEVQCGELSLKDLSQKCKVIKKMKEIKLAFMTQLDIGSWEEALQLYPTHTSDENLAQFTSLCFKKSNVPQTFCSFCTQAKQAILNKSIEQPTSVTDGLHVSYDNSFAVIINANVITVSTREILDGFGSLQCSGLHLTILDTPEDWSCTEVTTIVRLVRSTNIALGLSSFAVVVISPPQDLELQQQDCKAQTAYMQDTSAASKDTYTGCDLQNTITPMVIGQWSSCNEYPFFAKKTEFVGNLLTVAMDEPINTPQGRARPKPMLYQELIKLLTSPGQWVFDPLSGNGKVSSSAVKNGRSALALENNETQALLKQLSSIEKTVN